MEHTVAASPRAEKGRGAARRMRRDGRIPGIIYGEGEPTAISVDGHRLTLDLHRHESFSSSVLSIELEGKSMPALLREVQSHPVTGAVLHVDFQAVAADSEISVTVPLHYEGAEGSPGVKLEHGIFNAIAFELDIHCLPKALPEHISIDVSALHINESIHLEDIQLPEGVSADALARGENPVLAGIVPPQAEEEPQPGAEVEGAEAEAGAEEDAAKEAE